MENRWGDPGFKDQSVSGREMGAVIKEQQEGSLRWQNRDFSVFFVTSVGEFTINSKLKVEFLKT